MKVCINVYQNYSAWNLPRFIWVEKSNTLKELHINVFKGLKDIFKRWYEDPTGKADIELSNLHKNPETSKFFTKESIIPFLKEASIEE